MRFSAGFGDEALGDLAVAGKNGSMRDLHLLDPCRTRFPNVQPIRRLPCRLMHVPAYPFERTTRHWKSNISS
jgi:hypothetical protein